MHRHRRAARRDRVRRCVFDQMTLICVLLLPQRDRPGPTSVRTHTIRIICNRIINCISCARGRRPRLSPALTLGPRLRLTSKEAIFDAETRCGGFVRPTCPSRPAFRFTIRIEFQPGDMEIDWRQRRSRNERRSRWHWTAAARTQCEQIRYPRYPRPLFARSQRRRRLSKSRSTGPRPQRPITHHFLTFHAHLPGESVACIIAEGRSHHIACGHIANYRTASAGRSAERKNVRVDIPQLFAGDVRGTSATCAWYAAVRLGSTNCRKVLSKYLLFADEIQYPRNYDERGACVGACRRGRHLSPGH